MCVACNEYLQREKEKPGPIIDIFYVPLLFTKVNKPFQKKVFLILSAEHVLVSCRVFTIHAQVLAQ